MFDWQGFFTTIFATGFGALGAYFFNVQQAKNQQKNIEKAKLLKLFYDISILTKVFVYYYKNTIAEINNLTDIEVKSIVPIVINEANFKIEEYGFITQISPVLYEILTYVHHDINYILEQQAISSEFIENSINSKFYLDKLKHIEVSTVKLLAKLFVSLVNINNMLVKYFQCKNLIKDEVVNAYIRSKKIIDKVISEYYRILNNTKNHRKYTEEELKTIKADFEYLNEILKFWIVDFGLNNRQKTLMQNEISVQIQKKWEVTENDS